MSLNPNLGEFLPKKYNLDKDMAKKILEKSIGLQGLKTYPPL